MFAMLLVSALAAYYRTWLKAFVTDNMPWLAVIKKNVIGYPDKKLSITQTPAGQLENSSIGH